MGLDVAASLLKAVEAMLGTTVADHDEQQKNHSPLLAKTYKYASASAVFFLLRFCKSGEDMLYADKERANAAIRKAYDTFQRCSSHPSDELGRTAQVIKLLASSGASTNALSTDWGNSIITDAISRADEVRGRARMSDQNTSVDMSREENDSLWSIQGSQNLTAMELNLASLGDLDDFLTWPELEIALWQDQLAGG